MKKNMNATGNDHLKILGIVELIKIRGGEQYQQSPKPFTPTKPK